jgi:hypothetical protein
LLELLGESGRQRVVTCEGLRSKWRQSERRLNISILVGHLQDPCAFNPFDQDLGISIGEFQALNDCGNGADRKYFSGLGIVDGGVVLGCQEDPFIASSAASRALTEDSRPITNGTIMNGKITTSRIGTMGSRVCSYLSLVLIL